MFIESKKKNEKKQVKISALVETKIIYTMSFNEACTLKNLKDFRNFCFVKGGFEDNQIDLKQQVIRLIMTLKERIVNK